MPDSRIRLVAGLGNPGPEYAATRHNVGFMALDFFAGDARMHFKSQAKWGAAVARAGEVTLVKPMTFMNRSGEPLAAVADFYKIDPEQILIVLDDFALPLGRLRLREHGGSGGHNGLESVIMNLATEEVPRLRLGIGTAPERGSVDYVLGRFFDDEKERVRGMLTGAAEAIKCAIDNGVTSAMNKFNRASAD